MHGNMGVKRPEKLFDEIEKYYGTEPDAMYEKSVEDNCMRMRWSDYGIIIQMLLNQMYKEMMDAYEERYRENNSTVNLIR